MISADLRERLSALPALRPQSRFDQATTCKLCAHVCPPFDVVDFNKFCSGGNFYSFGLSGIPVTYYRCSWCRFLFTRFFDDWSPEDFRDFIYNDDYIRVDGAYVSDRPKKDAKAVAALLNGVPRDVRILDYGSGSGIFGRELAGKGYTNVTSYDPFAQPEPPSGDFDLITLFEVIEHVPDSAAVLTDVKRLLRPGAAILFSSGFQPPNIMTMRANWWYVGPRNGHCSIFSVEAMAMVAERLGLSLRGETGLCALQSWPPSDITTHITRAMPDALFVRHLTPPDTEQGRPGDGEPRRWHGLENSPAGAFRWTASPRLAWDFGALPCAPSRLRVLLPTVNECAPGYAASCSLRVTGCKTVTTAADGGLQADCPAGTAPFQVVLEGPDFPPPRGKDTRPIGLAVMAG